MGWELLPGSLHKQLSGAAIKLHCRLGQDEVYVGQPEKEPFWGALHQPGTPGAEQGWWTRLGLAEHCVAQ